MKTFWRQFLTDTEDELLGALMEAHHKSCFRDNASSMAVILAADASRDYCKAISAGIATLGGKHAPLEETLQFLSIPYPATQVGKILKEGRTVPGWGGTFQKASEDPLWREVSQLLGSRYPALHNKMKDVTEQLTEYGKHLYPNPSAYTACVGIALEMPPAIISYLLICGRLAGWTEIAAQHLGQK
jgi:citrate synthase